MNKSEWRSVADDPPPKNVRILTVRKEANYDSRCIAMLVNDTWKRLTSSSRIDSHYVPTHWQPLPELPK